MEPLELLEALVSVVATLGQLAATVAGPYGDVLLTGSPRSLHMALGTFIDHLRDTLRHSGDTNLGQALAALGATPGSTWAHVRAAARAWHGLVVALRDSWDQLSEEATKLCDACGDAANTEATTKAIAIAQAGDLQEKTARWGTAIGNLVAVVWQPPVTLAKDEVDSSLAHEARMAAASAEEKAATEAWEEAVLATSQAAAATRREQRAEKALGPLKSLVAACDRDKAFPQELLRQLRDIEATLKVTEEASANVPEALVATVAEAEQLWEASTRLATRHLLGTLGDIRTLISKYPCGPGGPDGRVVAEQCQKAIEDIPKLLGRQ